MLIECMQDNLLEELIKIDSKVADIAAENLT